MPQSFQHCWEVRVINNKNTANSQNPVGIENVHKHSLKRMTAVYERKVNSSAFAFQLGKHCARRRFVKLHQVFKSCVVQVVQSYVLEGIRLKGINNNMLGALNRTNGVRNEESRNTKCQAYF